MHEHYVHLPALDAQFPTSRVPQQESDVNQNMPAEHQVIALRGLARRKALDENMLVDTVVALSSQVDALGRAGSEYEVAQIQSASQAEEFKDKSQRNPLTGLLNQPSFAKQVEARIGDDRRRHQRGRHDFVFFLDLDYLNHWNTILSEPLVNGSIIIPTAEVIAESARKEDIVSHWGGDEFSLYLSNISRPNAEAFAERLGKRVNSIDIKERPDDGPSFLGVSIGFTAIRPTDSYETAELRAARAKQYAKEHGRNQAINSSDVPRSWQPKKISKTFPAS